MIVSRIYDSDVITAIATAPEIWETIAEDGQDPSKYKPDLAINCWLLMTDDTVLGLYQFKRLNGVTAEIHPMIFKEFRSEFARESCIGALRWMYENASWCKKITAMIPVIYKHVKRFALSMGFKQEGINRMSYQKNSILIDQTLLGITRDEIAEVIK